MNFRDWQKKFYKSKKWINLRNYVRLRDNYTCQHCKRLIVKDKWIVDHIVEINEKNKNDNEILYNKNNLELLCISCHNKKTFGSKKKQIREIDYDKRDVFK